MKTQPKKMSPADEKDFFENYWEKSWTLVKTVVNVVREPVLILDEDLRVMAANEAFYSTFRVTADDTKERVVYDLGNGQWDIPALRKLLTEILSRDTFFKGFQVAHEFPSLGRRVMVLNARRIYIHDDAFVEKTSPIILLAIEDVTEMMVVAEELANHAKRVETTLTGRIGKLEKELLALKKK